MGIRSKTLPIDSNEPRDSQSSKAPIVQSLTGSTSRTSPSQPEPSKHHNFRKTLPFTHSNSRNAYNASTVSEPQRPGIPRRQDSVHTRYMEMLLGMDEIPRLHNILASFFTWIVLAGFVIFPGTFTDLAQLDNNATVKGNGTAAAILASVKNVPLLVIAGVCCGIGALGMLWLWWVWRKNYVWLLNRIFLPGFLNSFAGLISTLINVYTQQNGNWSITAEVTAIVTGACMVILALLFALYNFWVLERVKRNHGREMEIGRAHDETLAEKVERKAKEPALEPGSVV